MKVQFSSEGCRREAQTRSPAKAEIQPIHKQLTNLKWENTMRQKHCSAFVCPCHSSMWFHCCCCSHSWNHNHQGSSGLQDSIAFHNQLTQTMTRFTQWSREKTLLHSRPQSGRPPSQTSLLLCSVWFICNNWSLITQLFPQKVTVLWFLWVCLTQNWRKLSLILTSEACWPKRGIHSFESPERAVATQNGPV